jgi:hypothetical protein
MSKVCTCLWFTIAQWPVASKKQYRRVRINFAVERGIPPFSNSLLLIELNGKKEHKQLAEGPDNKQQCCQ